MRRIICTAAIAAATFLVSPLAASAQDYPPPSETPSVLPTELERPDGGGLPATGADLVAPAAIAAAALAGGSVLVARARRRVRVVS